MSFGGGSPNIDNSVNKQSAQLTRAQYEDFKRRFEPLEDYALNRLGDQSLAERRVNRSARLAGEQFDNSMAITRRELGRYGIDINPDRARTMERAEGLGKTLAKVGAANTTRDAIEAGDLRDRQALISLGRGLRSDVGNTYTNLAGMESQRNSANRSIKAQKDANTMAGIGTAAGIGLGIAGLMV